MERKNENDSKKESTDIKPDKETLHSTDPQKHMKGPVSSPTRETGKPFESDENKKNADERREGRM